MNARILHSGMVAWYVPSDKPILNKKGEVRVDADGNPKTGLIRMGFRYVALSMKTKTEVWKVVKSGKRTLFALSLDDVYGMRKGKERLTVEDMTKYLSDRVGPAMARLAIDRCFSATFHKDDALTITKKEFDSCMSEFPPIQTTTYDTDDIRKGRTVVRERENFTNHINHWHAAFGYA